jgi:hypothetical protein
MTQSRVRHPHHCMYLSLSALLLLLPLSRISAQTAPPTASSPQAATPITMTECEGTNNCATWTLLGSQGNGKWPSGEEANLTVEKAEADTVVIRRADSTGPSAGLTATYTGTRHGDRIGGEFISSWPGHWSNQTGNWYATVEHLPQGLPPVMRFCGPAHCGTLTWTNGSYDAAFDDQKHTPGESIFKVQLFKPEAILINRIDTDGTMSALTGRMSDQGNSVVDGHITFTHKDGQFGTFNYQLTWGTALNSAKIPGQQQPPPGQPVLVVRPALVCFPWFFGVTCD